MWGRDFTLAFVVNFFISVVFYLLMTSMALYAVDRFMANDTLAGLAASMFVIGSLFSRIFAGRLLDIVGRRRMLVLSLVVFVLASILYIPAGDLGVLLLVRLVHGMAYGAGNTAITASVQALIPPARRSEGNGYFGLSMTLAAAVGPMVATALGAGGHFRELFLFSAASSVVALLGSLVLRLPEQPASAEQRANWWRVRGSDLIDPRTVPIGMIMLLSAIGYSGIITFLTSYARQQNFVGAASAFFIVYAAATLVSRLFLGRIQDRRGDNAVMYPIMILFAIALLLLGLVPAGWSVVVSGVLAGVGFGGIIPCAQSIAVSTSPARRVGVVTSTFFLMFDAGVGLGPVLLGMIVPLLGYQGMYVSLSVLMVVTMGVYTLVHGRRAQETRREAAAQKVGPADAAEPAETTDAVEVAEPPAPTEAADAGPQTPTPQTVLVGVNGSVDSDRAVRYAQRAGHLMGADIRLVAALDETALMTPWGAFDDPAEITRDLRDALDRARHELEAEGVPAERVRTELLEGHAGEVLSEQSAGADLVVVGRRSVSGLQRMFVGSTSVAVASAAECPVVVVSADTDTETAGAHGVVAVAVGPGASPRPQLEWGFHVASLRGAALRVVQVLPPQAGGDLAAERHREREAERHRDLAATAGARLEEHLASLRAEHAAVTVRTETVRGSPVEELVELTGAVDLLVIGSAPRPLSGFALGGVTRGVMAHAQCAIVLAPASSRDRRTAPAR